MQSLDISCGGEASVKGLQVLAGLTQLTALDAHLKGLAARYGLPPYAAPMIRAPDIFDFVTCLTGAGLSPTLVVTSAA